MEQILHVLKDLLWLDVWTVTIALSISIAARAYNGESVDAFKHMLPCGFLWALIIVYWFN